MKNIKNFKKQFIILTFFCLQVNYSQTVPNFDWSIKGSGTLRDVGLAVTVDQIGNVYLTGEFFSSSLVFPGKILTMPGGTGNCDFFLAKFNPFGRAIWGINGGGSLTDRGYGVALDHLGNLFATGHYFGTATFGPYTLTSSGNLDCFTAKLDTLGTYIWMKEGKSVSQVSTRSMTIDANGNIIIVGYYGSSTVDSVRFDGIKIITNGQRDCFVVKYNNSGIVQWGVTGGGISSGEQANDVAIDNVGNIYVTGVFTDTANFSGIVLNGKGGTEVFIAKYNLNGQIVWAKSVGGIKSDDGSGIALDKFGNVYVVGRFDSAAVFGSTQVVGNGGYDAFITRYDTAGNFIWVKYGGGTGSDYLKDIECDASGNIFGTGYFSAQATFGANVLTSTGLQDILFIKYNPAGDVIWTKQAGGADNDEGNRMCLDLGVNLISSGVFQLTAYFGPDTLTSAGVQDIFLSKIGNNPLPVELTSFTAKYLDSKIVLHWVTATELNNKCFEIERSSDNKGFSKIGIVDGNGSTSERHEYEFRDHEILHTKYFYRLKQIDFDGTSEHSKVVEIDVSLPAQFELYQNYPNPFNPATTISFDLPSDAQVNLSIYNVVGEHIADLVKSNYSAGKYSIEYDASSLASGIYLYQLCAIRPNGVIMSDTKKMIIMR